MHLPNWIRKAILASVIRNIENARPPDVIIGEGEFPYLKRWWVIPRNKVFNIYFHHFMRSDDDRAMHDHPWANASILLDGAYFETVPLNWRNPLGFTVNKIRGQGDIVIRPRGEYAHRVNLYPSFAHGPGESPERMVRTLFITGPTHRKWGFWCPQGWRHWAEFTKPANGSKSGGIGRGCGEYE